MVRKKLHFLFLSMILFSSAHSKNFLKKLAHNHCYITTPALAALTAFCAAESKKDQAPLFAWSLAVLSGVYALWNRATINYIEDYYTVKRIEDNWATPPRPLKHFSTWRQADLGDGEIYWATAWQLEQEFQMAKEQFLSDMYAGSFSAGQGLLTPFQLLARIDAEVALLQADKSKIAAITSIYLDYDAPEEFCPDGYFGSFLRPNHNHASHLYIRLDALMKRLKIIKKIVGALYQEEGFYGWPTRPTNTKK